MKDLIIKLRDNIDTKSIELNYRDSVSGIDNDILYNILIKISDILYKIERL